MAIEDEVLKRLLEKGVFDNDDKAEGIAKRGADKGYATLTAAQRYVVDPYMIIPCDGVENLGGHHNDCSVQMQGQELVTALDDEGYYEGLLCTDCRSEHFEMYE